MKMKRAQMKNPELLLQKLQYLNWSQKNMVKKAYLLAEDAHKFQKRLSGEPYIIHPLNVAMILADFKLDHETICAALLHDVLEDTVIEEQYLRKEFGDITANLVKAVTNISVIKNKNRAKIEAENMRRMILETVKDPRVILVKLADKLHNLRTLEFQSPQKARRIAREALDIYAPLAGRLGIYKIKSEIEDICLLFLYNKTYYKIRKMISEKKSTRDRRIKAIGSILDQKMREQKIKCVIEGRSKHFFSIYQKMIEKNKNYDEIYDLTGLRIQVDTLQDCYKTLGVIHTLWRPIPGRFKDYISVPKSNGYQSLHTTVIGHGGKPIEFQIRTKTMHLLCEMGIAAHWMYKGEKNNPFPDFVNIFQNIADLNAERQNSIGFLKDLKDTLVDEEIHTFTPKGEVITLPKDSVVLDFAFQIHTDLGIHCAGAEIDSRFVSIRTPLKNGNQVNIITNPSIIPAKRWMHIVKSSHARSKLRGWFKRHQKLYNKKNDSATDLTDEPRELTGSSLPAELVIIKNSGKSNNHTDFERASCCQPLPDNEIIGVTEDGHHINVHSRSCSEIRNLLKKKPGGKILEMLWNEAAGPILFEITISTLDDQNVLMQLTGNILSTGAHIFSINMESFSSNKVEYNQDRFFQGVIQVECDHIRLMQNIMSMLKAMPSIQKLSYKILQTGGRELN